MSALIGDATMTRLRALDRSAMPSSCRVLRPAVVIGGGTSTVEEATLVAGPVACRVMRINPATRPGEVYGRPDDEPPADIALPLGTTVADLDWIEATTPLPDGDQVETFQVTGDPWAPDYATSLHALAYRRDERDA